MYLLLLRAQELLLGALENYIKAVPWELETWFCNRWALKLSVKRKRTTLMVKNIFFENKK